MNDLISLSIEERLSLIAKIEPKFLMVSSLFVIAYPTSTMYLRCNIQDLTLKDDVPKLTQITAQLRTYLLEDIVLRNWCNFNIEALYFDYAKKSYLLSRNLIKNPIREVNIVTELPCDSLADQLLNACYLWLMCASESDAYSYT